MDKMFEEFLTLIQKDINLDKHFVIRCYNKWEMFKEKDRKKQMQFYEECMANSEGSERERYVNVYFDLKNKFKIIFDDDDDRRNFEYFIKHCEKQKKAIENKVFLGVEV